MVGELSGLLSLGVGGAIAAIVLYWKRSDDRAYQRSLAGLAREANEVNSRVLAAFEANTRAVMELTIALRRDGVEVDVTERYRR